MPTIYKPLATGATPTLGTSGDAVKALQIQLNTQNAGVAGYIPLKVDGLYGPKTQAAATGSTPVGSVSNPSIISTSIAGQSNFNTENARLGTLTAQPTGTGSSKVITSRSINPDGTYNVVYSDGTTGKQGLPTNSVFDKNASEELDRAAQLKAQAEYQESLKRRENLLNLTNNLIDTQTASTVQGIIDNYDKLSTAKNRILQKQIDRSTAYGLAGGGRTVSQQFNNAIDLQETQREDELAAIARERDNMVASARAAAASGKINAMKEANDGIERLAGELRNKLSQINKESSERYNQFLKVEAEGDKARAEAIKTEAQRAAFVLGGSFSKAKTDEERQKLIADYMQQNAFGTPQNAPDAFAAIINSVGTKAALDKKNALDATAKDLANQKKAIDIKNVKNIIKNRDIKTTNTVNKTTQKDTIIAPDGKAIQIIN